jgi:hypothetical protein
LPIFPVDRYDFIMLNLHAPTPPRWLEQVSASLDELLIDHAHCEKKAAGVAMNLLFAYVDRVELVRDLSDIVREELCHFHLVLDLLERRAIRFRKLPASQYGQRLHRLASKQEPMRAVDRLLIAGLMPNWPRSSAACSNRKPATTAFTFGSPSCSRRKTASTIGWRSWPSRRPVSSRRGKRCRACTVDALRFRHSENVEIAVGA